ncbi:MAG: prolyl aminopeptidase [Pseudomonadota bacterium]|nr:prolyl aminopeptidase [Pseudomonadota bacterium]
MRGLYPVIAAYQDGFLQVSPLHRLYYAEYGNPNGIPVVFLHGGPGGGLQPNYARYFDPQKWRIVLFDQRGCGRSTPFAELRDNTTWDLVADIEALRHHLKIQRWAVFGGSWGSTLALAYGIRHPACCTGFFLRGIFLLRKKEIDWFYQSGCSKLFPEAWADYLAVIPIEEQDDLVHAYFKRLNSPDPLIRQAAAKAWSTWEGSTSKLIPDPQMIAQYGADHFAEAFARIECHYFVNRGFFPTDQYLLEHIAALRHIPCTIVHGRYDVVCPVENAWELHQAWPEATLRIIADAGHALSETGITDALIRATDAFNL